MPKQNPASIVELGRIKHFKTVTLLAEYLKVDTETCFRWRRELKKEDKPMIRYHNHVMIDFEPEIIN